MTEKVPHATSRLGPFFRWLGNVVGPVAALLAVALLFAVLDRVFAQGTFATFANLRTVTVQTCVVAVAALGMTIIIIAGGIDLSCGTAIALAATVLAWGLREDAAVLLTRGTNHISLSRQIVAAQRRAASGEGREQAQAEIAALRQQLAALLESKRPLETDAPKTRRRYTVEGRLAKLTDPDFRVTDTPDWLEGVPNSSWTPLVAILMGLLTGIAAGLLNGLLVSSLRLVPFIVTLGTMTIFLGVGNLLSGNIPVRPALEQIPHPLATIVSNSPESLLLGFPWGAWLALAMALFLAAILKFTVFGRYVFALGSNEATARLCGINVPGYKIAVYTLGGLLFGIAGIYQFARLSTGNPMSGAGLELKVIAAVVIGGGSLSGGRGTVVGTLAGAAIMAVISSGCTQLGVSNSVQDIILGAVIIGAVAIDQLRQRVTAS